MRTQEKAERGQREDRGRIGEDARERGKIKSKGRKGEDEKEKT